jgi:hypothetical protein
LSTGAVGVGEEEDEPLVLVLEVVLMLEPGPVVESVTVDKGEVAELMLAFLRYKLNLFPAPQYSKSFPTV